MSKKHNCEITALHLNDVMCQKKHVFSSCRKSFQETWQWMIKILADLFPLRQLHSLSVLLIQHRCVMKDMFATSEQPHLRDFWVRMVCDFTQELGMTHSNLDELRHLLHHVLESHFLHTNASCDLKLRKCVSIAVLQHSFFFIKLQPPHVIFPLGIFFIRNFILCTFKINRNAPRQSSANHFTFIKYYL